MGKRAVIPNVTMRVRIGEREIEVSGPADFVEKRIADFVGSDKTAEAGSTAKREMPTSKTSTTPTGNKASSPAQFFNKLSPGSDVERVLIGAYFLEHVNRQESFTAQEVRDLIKSAKRSPPANVSDAINKNIAKGLIMTAGDKEGRMAFVLTSDGEEKVSEMSTQT